MKTRKFTDEQLVNAVKQHQNITQADLAKVMDCSVTTISNNIRHIVKEGRLIQTADNYGVYHYDVPAQEVPVTVHTVEKVIEVPKVVEVPFEVPVDQTKIWINEVRQEIRRELDAKVRSYLNNLYLKMMQTLTQELGLQD